MFLEQVDALTDRIKKNMKESLENSLSENTSNNYLSISKDFQKIFHAVIEQVSSCQTNNYHECLDLCDVLRIMISIGLIDEEMDLIVSKLFLRYSSFLEEKKVEQGQEEDGIKQELKTKFYLLMENLFIWSCMNLS